MSEQDGLVCAYILDGKGGGREVGWTEIRKWRPTQGVLWLHFDRGVPATERWLEEESGIDPLVCESLVSEESSPRVATFDQALLINLRGVNLNPGADPEDMVSVRIWAESGRIITVRRRRLLAIQDIRDGLAEGDGPQGPGAFVAFLAANLVGRMGPVIAGLEDRLDELEDTMLTAQLPELRATLSELRRTAIALRRYLSPQREVLSRVREERMRWLKEEHRTHLRETAHHTARLVDDLSTLRERGGVTQDELNARLSDQMNRTMYLLTLVASLLLPLSFLTGLLGINVGGIPGAETPWAFASVVIIMVLLGGLEVWLLRRLKWI